MAKKKNGDSKPQPLSVGKFVDRVLMLRAEQESAVDKVRITVERRFQERESKLLERVPDEKRMIAQACLLAAMEQKSKAVGSIDHKMHEAVSGKEPPV
jgi:hypothetical protein